MADFPGSLIVGCEEISAAFHYKLDVAHDLVDFFLLRSADAPDH